MNKRKKHTEPPEIAVIPEVLPEEQASIITPEPLVPGDPALDAKTVTHMSDISDCDIPDCPPEDPMQGDKTPAVVAWWFQYYPAEAEVKYADRNIQLPTDHE